MDSPFETVFAPYADRFPPAFRKQYLLPSGSGRVVHFDGVSDRIWNRPAWLWPFFQVLSCFDILFPETGTNIPSTMKLTGGRDRHGEPYQRWDRVFSFHVPRRFNAVMAYDKRIGRVVEHFTPQNILTMIWNISFEPPATISIFTGGCRLDLAGLKIPLHPYLHPHVRAVEQAIDEDTIHIDLRASHPLLGEIFGYEGYYRIQMDTQEK